MRIRVAGLSIVPNGPVPTGNPPARADGCSPTWRCPSCGTERHFPGPVPMRVAIPCSACGLNALEMNPTGEPPVPGSTAGAPIIRKLLLLATLGVASLGCGQERETGVPPSAVSDSAILADTARRDKVDLEGIRGEK